MSLQQGIPRNIIVPSTQNSTQSDEPIYILTIELEQGKTTELKIYINSIPEELSYDFCHQHNLDYHSLNYLTEQIKILINEHKTKQNSLEANTTTNNNVIKDQPQSQTESKTSSLKTAPIPSYHRNKHNNNNNNNDLSSYHSSVNSTHKKQRHHSSKQISTTKEHIKHASSLSHKTNYNESKSSTNNKHNLLLITTNNHFSIHSNVSSKLQNTSELQQQQQQHDNTKLNAINNKLKIESDNNSYTFKGGKQLTSSSYIVTDNNCKSNDYHKKRKGRSHINNSNSLYTNNNTTHDNKSFTSNCIKDKQKVITPFTTRQSMYRKQSEAKYHKIRNELYPPVDNKTGQLFFHPKLYNQHKHMTHLNNYSNIFNNLYAYAEKYKDNQYKRDNKMKHEILDMSNMKKISDNSNEILQRKKNEIFKSIFRCFDVDEDGLISIFTIDCKKIPNDIYQIIKPIIEELKEYQGSITENEFVNECNILFDVSYLYIYIYIYVILL